MTNFSFLQPRPVQTLGRMNPPLLTFPARLDRGRCGVERNQRSKRGPSASCTFLPILKQHKHCRNFSRDKGRASGEIAALRCAQQSEALRWLDHLQSCSHIIWPTGARYLGRLAWDGNFCLSPVLLDETVFGDRLSMSQSTCDVLRGGADALGETKWGIATQHARLGSAHFVQRDLPVSKVLGRSTTPRWSTDNYNNTK